MREGAAAFPLTRRFQQLLQVLLGLFVVAFLDGLPGRGLRLGLVHF